jgi:hypothetical protein
MTATTFVPAFHCSDAVLTLRWECLDKPVYGWELRRGDELIDSLVGYPVGAPANSKREALAWAATVVGDQQWIEKPSRSGAFHTHQDAGAL